MKKLFAYVIAMSVASTAMAGSVGFDFGTNFYKPHASGGQAANGSNFLVSWVLDNDVSLGVYTELSNVAVNDTAGVAAASTLSVNAIQVTKGIMKNVTVGLNLGSGALAAAAPLAAETKPLVDILGTVDILSGTGDKIQGALRASVAARFLNTSTGTNPKLDGVNVGLAVQLLY
jgi:hypothetical protein